MKGFNCEEWALVPIDTYSKVHTETIESIFSDHEA